MEQAQLVLHNLKSQITQEEDLFQLRQLRMDGLSRIAATDIHSLNELYDALIERVVYLSERESLIKHGLGVAPVPYAFLLFGSGGRREQVIGSDQDNGVIYEDVEDSVKALEVERYFEHFAETLTRHLVTLGYSECSGRVLAVEPRWRKSSGAWLVQIREWMDEPTFENVRCLLVLADSRCLFGEKRLLESFREKYYQAVRGNHVLLQAMLRNTMRRKVLVGVFGHLIKEQFGEAQGGLDIKYGAYVPFVNSIRLLSIFHQIPSSCTLRRIELLTQNGCIERNTADEWLAAFQTILMLRGQTYLKDDESLLISSGKLKAVQLNKENVNKLKSSMRVAKQLQLYTRKFIERATGGPSTWI